jgi:hypothetical protein
MKTYEIEIRYTAYANYVIEADSPEEAERQAWADVNSDPDHAMSLGEWECLEVEEVTNPEDYRIEKI